MLYILFVTGIKKTIWKLAYHKIYTMSCQKINEMTPQQISFVLKVTGGPTRTVYFNDFCFHFYILQFILR